MDDTTGRVGEKPARNRRPAAPRPASTAGDPALPQETDERARELRAEIAETRGAMTETIEAIQERLKPSTLMANASETVRTATTEKVKQMANTAGDAADRMMNNTVMDTVRDHPVPAAMIGIGAAWLIMKGRSESRRYHDGRSLYGPGHDRSVEYDWRERTAGATELYDTRNTEDRDASSGISAAASDAASRASEYVNDARYAARRTGRRAQNTFDRVMRENPLALGAAATIVGAAIGMTIPATEAENEWMGDARDTVVDRAREMATDAAERVQNAAEQVKDVASQPADDRRR